MNVHRFRLPLVFAVAAMALASVGAQAAKAHDYDRPWRGHSYSSGYYYRSGGCYAPRPTYYYREVRPRVYYDSYSYYPRRTYGISINVGRSYGDHGWRRHHRSHRGW